MTKEERSICQNDDQGNLSHLIPVLNFCKNCSSKYLSRQHASGEPSSSPSQRQANEERKLPVICRGSAYTHEDSRVRHEGQRSSSRGVSSSRPQRNFTRQIWRPGPSSSRSGLAVCAHTMHENRWGPSSSLDRHLRIFYHPRTSCHASQSFYGYVGLG